MKKTLITAALSFALLLSLCTIPVAASDFIRQRVYDGRFSDVDESQWFASEVASAYEYGLIDGTSDVAFSPKGNVTVAQAIKLVACIRSIYNNEYDTAFAQSDPWYQTYVDYAVQEGVIETSYDYYGKASIIGSKFDYNAPVTRFEFAQILVGALSEEELPTINSVPAIPDVCIATYAGGLQGDSVYRLYRAGILSGTDDIGSFSPDATIQRSEAAAIVVRMVDAESRKTFSLPTPTITAPSELAVSFDQADYDAILDAEIISMDHLRFTFDGNDAVLTWSNEAMEKYRMPDWGTEDSDYWGAHIVYYNIYVQDTLVFSTFEHWAPLKNLSSSGPSTVKIVPEIVVNVQTNERYYGDTAEMEVTIPEGKIGPPVRIIEGYGYDPFYGADMNSVGGIELRWSGENNTGKTINYYTVHLSFTNAVGDPAYDEITGQAEKSIRYVGPVYSGGGLMISKIVTYNSTCGFITIDSFYVEYTDGTSELIPYNHTVTVR